jgi:hypothetical protein
LLSIVSRQRSTILAACGRRRLSGELLAHHQGEGILQRRVGLVGDLLVLAHAVVMVFQPRREVLRDARHAVGADRLDAGVLHRLEDGAGLLALGDHRAVDLGIVHGELQRHGVAVAAHDRGVLRRELARRLGQARLVTREARLVGGIGDFEVAAGDGAHAGGDRALERLGRALLGVRLGLGIGAHERSFFSQMRRCPGGKSPSSP